VIGFLLLCCWLVGCLVCSCFVVVVVVVVVVRLVCVCVCVCVCGFACFFVVAVLLLL